MPERRQLSSHVNLLDIDEAPYPSARRVDAIVVPSARTPPYLLHAASLAQAMKCPLLILCSKRAQRSKIVTLIKSSGYTTDLIVIDMPGRLNDPMPKLATAGMFSGTPFERRTDVSLKRNLALLFARMVDWKSIVFLDDDVEVSDPRDLDRVVSALDGHAAAGMHMGGFADNSVLCHAIRDVGLPQDTFVGAGALAIPTDFYGDAFFPDIYNEDWFILLGDSAIRPVALVGNAVQYPYDPYHNPSRARSEEFGDSIAEGVFAVLSTDGKIDDTLNERYWGEFLAARRNLIEAVIAAAQSNPKIPNQSFMVAALKAARGRSQIIEPADCIKFLEGWKKDRTVWEDAVNRLPTQLTYTEAASRFNLREQCSIRIARAAVARAAADRDYAVCR